MSAELVSTNTIAAILDMPHENKIEGEFGNMYLGGAGRREAKRVDRDQAAPNSSQEALAAGWVERLAPSEDSLPKEQGAGGEMESTCDEEVSAGGAA